MTTSKTDSQLFLFANGFPYGPWEPYLESEIPFYKNKFSKVFIASLQIRRNFKTTRELPSFFEDIPVWYAPKIIYLFYALRVFLDKNFYFELKELFHQKKLGFRRLVELIIYLSRSHFEAKKIICQLKKKDLANQIVLYSYRFEYQAYVAILVRNKLFPNAPIIARAHGYDLYEERRKSSYIPLRKFLLQELSACVFISQQGLEYINMKYPQFQRKLKLYRLGTFDMGISNIKSPKEVNTLKLLSASNLFPVKRVDKIIQALSLIQDIQIEWTHYGDGPLSLELQLLYQKILKENVKVLFKGHISNKALLEKYTTESYHIFLNTSESEGLPVSIMEAMSFSIPCIATNVGGTKEILKDSINGFLLDKDFSPEDLATRLMDIYQMPSKEYQSMRRASRLSWEETYDAKSNYNSFTKFLKEIK